MTRKRQYQNWIPAIQFARANAGLLAGLVWMSAFAQAQTYTVLHGFGGGAGGGLVNAGVIRDSAGNLYGTTYEGGRNNLGVVFKLDPTGKETVLHTFTGGLDGADPYAAGLIRDSAGNFYGTAAYRGAGSAGVVFKLSPTGAETVLHAFMGGLDGANPYAPVIRDSAGNLYGTTYNGGASGVGVVYEVDATGTESVLHTFTGPDGANPVGSLTRDSAGNLYGTTVNGGAFSLGAVFKLDPAGNETVLHSFTGGADGGGPFAGVIRDSAGNLYGTTISGGTFADGVVFKLSPAGKEKVLHAFSGGDGANPYAGLVRDSAGNLYGTTYGGGGNYGVVFKLDPTGQETVLHTFTLTDGAGPFAALIRDSAGNLYGTTTSGGPPGASGLGVVFKLTP